MRPRNIMAVLSVLSVCASLSVSAQTGQNGSDNTGQAPSGNELDRVQRMVFNQLDTNSDGMVSEEEALVNESLLLAFDELDGDDDGGLDFEEIKGWRAMELLESKF